MAFVVNESTGEGFVFKGILLLEVRRMGRRVTANLYRGKDIPAEMGASAYITAAVIPDTYVLEQHRRVCTINGYNPDINVEFTFDIMDTDMNRRFFIGLWSQQFARQECHDFVGGFSFAIQDILENDMGGWYYLLPQVVGLRSYAKVTHYAFDVLSKEYEQKCWLLLKAGRGIKVSFEKDLPATIKRVNRAALDAGLLEGDVILEMNRRDVSNCSGDIILAYMWEFIHTDIELLVARFICVDYPEPYQRDHYRIIISNEPTFCESSPLESEPESPYDFALDESPTSPLPGRSIRLENTDKTPGKGAAKSLGKRISGAMTKISRQLFGKKIRPKSQERGRPKSQERGRSKSQERGRFYDSEHGGRSPRKPKRLSRPYSSFRSTSASRSADLYTEEDKENVNDHVYENLESLVSSPIHLGRRLQSLASVSALHSEEVKPMALRSALRSRHTKSIASGFSSDSEQLKPMVTSSTRTSRLFKSTTSGSVFNCEEEKPTDSGSELKSRCLKTAGSVSVLNNEEVKTMVSVSNMNSSILKSIALGSSPNGKEVASTDSCSNLSSKCLNSVVSGSALNSNKVNLMVASSTLNGRCLKPMASGSALNSEQVNPTVSSSALNSRCLKPVGSSSMLNIVGSDATHSNSKENTECQQSKTTISILSSEHLKSTMASGSTPINEPPISRVSSSTPNEECLKFTTSRLELLNSHGAEGLSNSWLPSQSLTGNYFSPKCFMSNCVSPNSFTGTCNCLKRRILNLKQRSLMHVNQPSFDVQDTTFVCSRDQRDSIKPNELTKSVDQDSTFDCTFVSDIIQEDGGEEPMSWVSSFNDSSFSRPVYNLDEELKTTRFSS